MEDEEEEEEEEEAGNDNVFSVSLLLPWQYILQHGSCHYQLVLLQWYSCLLLLGGLTPTGSLSSPIPHVQPACLMSHWRSQTDPAFSYLNKMTNVMNKILKNNFKKPQVFKVL